MFTKLRNKFLIINMTITSLMMVTAFAVIYFITYSNIQSEIQNKLTSRLEMAIKIERSELQRNAEKGVAIVQRISLEDLLSFNIEVDANGSILNIQSFIDMPEEVYYKAAEAAWQHKDNYTTIMLESKKWQYVITPMNKQVLIRNGQQYSSTQNKYKIAFLDVTDAHKTLFELFITLISVGLMMLFIIFVISLYFANKAIKPIAENWEKQKQFIADASHELKTPLSIINANYDVLLANEEETIKSQLKWLDYMKVGTDRMTKLINDLLLLAKVDDVNLEMQKAPFNISSTISDGIASIESLVAEKGIKLTYTVQSDIIINGDAERIQQVAMILFDNAVKYTNENGTVDVSLIQSKNQVRVTVKNTGKGIAKDDLPKVFNRFYRADRSRTHENGSYGLGLSIAKTIIDRMGGHIHVTSVENEWTTFAFTLES